MLLLQNRLLLIEVKFVEIYITPKKKGQCHALYFSISISIS